jgi:hypothetical protein
VLVFAFRAVGHDYRAASRSQIMRSIVGESRREHQ